MFDEKFSRDALTGRISPEVMRARSEAERQLESDIRSAVGDDRYSALRRAADPDVRTRLLVELAARTDDPPEKAVLFGEAVALNGNLTAAATAAMLLPNPLSCSETRP